jgi:hypothetical protein
MSPEEMREPIYNLYPRKVAKRAALQSIGKALQRIVSGEVNQKVMTWEDAYKFLLTKTRQYAGSPAGNRGAMTPHCTTFMNQSRYLDYEIEWFRTTPQEERDLRNQMEANVGVWRPM